MNNKILSSKYGGIVLGDNKDTGDFKFFTYETLPVFTEKHQSLLSQVLNKDIFEKLKYKKTSTGFSFSNVIQSGVECHDLNLGVVAGDVDSYSVFEDLFDKIIKKYHNFDPAIRKYVSANEGDKLDLAEFNKLKLHSHIISTKITAVRNIAEYPLPAGTNYALRQETEEVLKKIFQMFKGGFSGKYFGVSDLSAAELREMHKKEYVFEEPSATGLRLTSGCARDWPKNRGIFCNDDHTIFGWCNNQDHAMLISFQQGHNIKKAFENLRAVSDSFIENLTVIGKNIMQNEILGYLSTCPSNLGAGLKVSMKIRAPKLFKDATKLNKICKDNLLEAKIINLVDDRKVETIVEISTKKSLYVTEIEFLQKFADGITVILQTEDKM